MGGQFVGGRRLCRDGRKRSGGNDPQVHPHAIAGPEHAAALKPRALARGVGSLELFPECSCRLLPLECFGCIGITVFDKEGLFQMVFGFCRFSDDGKELSQPVG